MECKASTCIIFNFFNGHMSRLWGNVKNETFPASLCCLYKLKLVDFCLWTQIDKWNPLFQLMGENLISGLTTSKSVWLYQVKFDIWLEIVRGLVQGEWITKSDRGVDLLTVHANEFNAAGLWIAFGDNGVRFSVTVQRMWLYLRSRVPRPT